MTNKKVMNEKTYAEQIADRQSKKKKIIIIIAFSLILLLIATVLSLSLIKIDLSPALFAKPDKIYFNDETSSLYNKQDEVFELVTEEYNNAFKTSIMSAIFEGRLSGYEIEENALTSLDEVMQDKTYITFKFNEPITLTDSNGYVYYSKFDNNNTLEIEEIVFEISNLEQLQETKIYCKYNWSTNQDESSGVTRYASINVKANTKGLFEIYENR